MSNRPVDCPPLSLLFLHTWLRSLHTHPSHASFVAPSRKSTPFSSSGSFRLVADWLPFMRFPSSIASFQSRSPSFWSLLAANFTKTKMDTSSFGDTYLIHSRKIENCHPERSTRIHVFSAAEEVAGWSIGHWARWPCSWNCYVRVFRPNIFLFKCDWTRKRLGLDFIRNQSIDWFLFIRLFVHLLSQSQSNFRLLLLLGRSVRLLLNRRDKRKDEAERPASKEQKKGRLGRFV